MSEKAAMTEAPDLQAIQKWILQMLEYEATNQTPAPLTSIQRRALLDLEADLLTPPEPEVGDLNWIGILQEHCAAKKTAVYYDESAVAHRTHATRWATWVRIANIPGVTFPVCQEDPPNGLPSFARKKESKQYAARCAMEWIRGIRPKPIVVCGGGDASSAAADANDLHRKKAASTPLQARQAKKIKGTKSSPSSTLDTVPTFAELFDPSIPSATITVSTLCTNLGIAQPSYRTAPTKQMLAKEAAATTTKKKNSGESRAIVPNDDDDDNDCTNDDDDDDNNNILWSGRADFPSSSLWAVDGTPFPADLGRVDHVRGSSKVVKEMVARKLVAFLEKAWEKRVQERDEILAIWDATHGKKHEKGEGE